MSVEMETRHDSSSQEEVPKIHVIIKRNEDYDSARVRHQNAVKKYYEKHKNEKYTCPICLGSITFSNKYHHNTSAKHLAWVQRVKEEKAKLEQANKDKDDDASKN
jgi:hypothetical protein